MISLIKGYSLGNQYIVLLYITIRRRHISYKLTTNARSDIMTLGLLKF